MNEYKRRLEKLKEKKKIKEYEKKQGSSSEKNYLDEEDEYLKRTSAHFFKLMNFNER